jgi:hypothetical protein
MTTISGKGDSGAQTIEVATDHITSTTTQSKDKAAALLEKAEADGHRVVVTPEDNKRILRQIDLIILPILLSVYGLQSLDKTSLSYASVFGLITDTHLVGQQYSVCTLGSESRYMILTSISVDWKHSLSGSACLPASCSACSSQIAHRAFHGLHGLHMGYHSLRYVHPSVRAVHITKLSANEH